MPELVAGGPIIPARLLNELDSGKVVFFCGAGISASQESDLPNFQDLVKHVYDEHHTEPDSVERETLGLVAVSHFDSDHISGLMQLLNKVNTKTLMLPWAPLVHRLLFGFQQNLAPGDPEFGFYVDPVAYLTEVASGGFEEIVFVPFGGDGGPPEPEDPPPDFDFDGKLDFECRKEDVLAAELTTQGFERSVSMLAPRSTLTVSGLWEFVPYNDPSTRPEVPGVFQFKVDKLRAQLLSRNKDDTKEALTKLKDLYVTTFPKSQLNDLSLFLYGGPTGDWPIFHLHAWQGPIGNRPILGWHWHYSHSHPPAASIIYTGDGNFSSPKRWETFRDYVGPKRALRPCVFQVPHHGSKKNWHSGLASTLSPTLSIFSSDPTHRGFRHPRGKVLRDFSGHEMAQVDKQCSFGCCLILQKNP